MILGPVNPSTTLSYLQQRAFNTAVDKGWWPKEDLPLRETKLIAEKLLLVGTEIAEGFEDIREHKSVTQNFYTKKGTTQVWNSEVRQFEQVTYEMSVPPWTGGKPCGFPSEMADVVIRVLDLCGAAGIDLEGAILEKMAFNDTRPYRHGGKAA